MVSKIIFKSKPMIRAPLMSKVVDPVKILGKNVARKKSCQHLFTKIMYMTATIYKILNATETEFRDGTNTHLIVRMADYRKLSYHCTKSHLG